MVSRKRSPRKLRLTWHRTLPAIETGWRSPTASVLTAGIRLGMTLPAFRLAPLVTALMKSSSAHPPLKGQQSTYIERQLAAFVSDGPQAWTLRHGRFGDLLDRNRLRPGGRAPDLYTGNGSAVR